MRPSALLAAEDEALAREMARIDYAEHRGLICAEGAELARGIAVGVHDGNCDMIRAAFGLPSPAELVGAFLNQMPWSR